MKLKFNSDLIKYGISYYVLRGLSLISNKFRIFVIRIDKYVTEKSLDYFLMYMGEK